MGRTRSQFNELQIFQLTIDSAEPQQCTHLVKPVSAASTGIHVQQIIGGIVFHQCDVRMSADKHIGPMFSNGVQGFFGVASRATADVHHQHTHPTANLHLHLRIPQPGLGSVDISVNPHDRLMGLQYLHHRQRSDIPRMPNLIHIVQIVENGSVHIPMGVT